jgi:hypothetical protein
MKVQLKINRLNATRIVQDTTDEMTYLFRHFPFKRFGDLEAGGYYTESNEGLIYEPHWGDWIIWDTRGPLAVLTEESFRLYFNPEAPACSLSDPLRTEWM